MKRFTAVLVAALFAGVALLASPASAQNFDPAPTVANTTPTQIRASGVVLAAAELSTTWSMSTFNVQDPKRIWGWAVYADYTTGSMTNLKVYPATPRTGNPAASGYFRNFTAVQTLDTSASSTMLFPQSQFGSSEYFGILVQPTGSQASSNLQMWVKPVYYSP